MLEIRSPPCEMSLSGPSKSGRRWWCGRFGGQGCPTNPQVGDLDCFVKRGGQPLLTSTTSNDTNTTFWPYFRPTSHAPRAGIIDRTTEEESLPKPTTECCPNMASRSANTQSGMGTSRQSMATSGSAIKARQLVCVDPFPLPGMLPSGTRLPSSLNLSTLARVSAHRAGKER